MTPRRPARTVGAAAIAALGLLAGCAQTSEIDLATERGDTPTEAAGDPPHWIRAGRLLAERTEAKRADEDASLQGDPTPSGSAAGADAGRLVAALTAAGVGTSQAECIADAVAESPALSADVRGLLDALSGGGAAALPSLDASLTTGLVEAVGPCLDAGTLAILVAGAGAASGSSTGLAGLAAVLGAAANTDLGAAGQMDPSALARQVAGALGPEQVRDLEAVLTAASRGTAVPALAGLDLSGLDLAKLAPQQLTLLLGSLLQGLTESQRQQLSGLANVDLSRLGDVLKDQPLTSEQVGSLLLLLAPFLGAGINVGAGRPPSPNGTTITIPPDLDLSSVNPFVFINRDAFVTAGRANGVRSDQAGCMYDRLRALTPTELAQAFTTNPDPVGLGKVVVATIGCIVAPAG